MCNINDNAVQGRLSESCLMRKSITRNICDLRYSGLYVLEIRLVCDGPPMVATEMDTFVGWRLPSVVPMVVE